LSLLFSYLFDLEKGFREWTLRGSDAVTQLGAPPLTPVLHNPQSTCPAPFPPKMTSVVSHPWAPSCLDKMSLQPPSYTPSAAVPVYSVIPRPSERILAATARSRRRTPTGVFVRSNNNITVALREQEQDASMPSYGRHGAICGDIALSCTQGVQSVYIKVRVCSLSTC